MDGNNRFWLTRLFYIRGLGFLYFVIGLILYRQGPDLIGPSGLTPVQDLVRKFTEQDQWHDLIYKYPSLLFLDSSNFTLYVMAGLFLVLGGFLIWGRANGLMLLGLWAMQLSLVNGAGLFWGFGWETMMLEMTLLAVFFVHPWRTNLLSPKNLVPTYCALWPLLWMMFRLMLGAGLIKVRGDACWLDFTCMDVHYQTQPNPHPLSWYYHSLPQGFHRVEVGMTHFYELLVPGLFLLPRLGRHLGALLAVLFQLTIISTGNLAYLNWQTIVLAWVAFDDSIWKKLVGPNTREQWKLVMGRQAGVTQNSFTLLVVSAVLILSFRPVSNMISSKQRMNQSYDSLHLVNSYGLFGSITKTRFEVVISGTRDEELTESTNWKEYEFKCKPGDVMRRPCWITPYHLRLDWQMWFSAMRPQLQEPWLVNLVNKMLTNDPLVDRQLATNPFSAGEPPRFIKMDLYEYKFTESSSSKNWWSRKRVKTYMPPISLKNFVRRQDP